MSFQKFLKRQIDFWGSLLGLILLSPLFLIITILIKIDSPGPIFFRQKRVGKDGKIFEIWKFRTMIKDQGKSNLSVNEIRKFEVTGQDPRITKLSHFLRRFAIDELPQLINILRGEMSFVGPRPYFLPRVQADKRLLEGRVKIKPGLTSLVVIKGGVHLSEEEILKLDLRYIEKQNLWLDFKILLKTISKILSGKGFYGK